MTKGVYVDESTLWKSVIGLVGLLFVWNNHRINSAHDKIDKERDASEARINLIYTKIAEGVDKTDKLRVEIKEDLDVRMTEPHIKEHVKMSIVPLENKIDAVHVDLRAFMARDK